MEASACLSSFSVMTEAWCYNREKWRFQHLSAQFLVWFVLPQDTWDLPTCPLQVMHTTVDTVVQNQVETIEVVKPTVATWTLEVGVCIIFEVRAKRSLSYSMLLYNDIICSKIHFTSFFHIISFSREDAICDCMDSMDSCRMRFTKWCSARGLWSRSRFSTCQRRICILWSSVVWESKEVEFHKLYWKVMVQHVPVQKVVEKQVWLEFLASRWWQWGNFR